MAIFPPARPDFFENAERSRFTGFVARETPSDFTTDIFLLPAVFL
jgi:hypothetical protein